MKRSAEENSPTTSNEKNHLERNREHAKRTRLRKKEMIESMKERVIELQREATELEQSLDESNTANILLGMGVGTNHGDSNTATVRNLPNKVNIHGNILELLRSSVKAETGKNSTDLPRKSDAKKAIKKDTLCVGESNIDGSDDVSTGQSTTSDVGRSSDVANEFSSGCPDITPDNPPTVICVQKMKNEPTPATEEDGRSKLEGLSRKERNKIHAQLTRDRKKLFSLRLQELITSLEAQNEEMRNRLQEVKASPNCTTVLPLGGSGGGGGGGGGVAGTATACVTNSNCPPPSSSSMCVPVPHSSYLANAAAVSTTTHPTPASYVGALHSAMVSDELPANAVQQPLLALPPLHNAFPNGHEEVSPALNISLYAHFTALAQAAMATAGKYPPGLLPSYNIFAEAASAAAAVAASAVEADERLKPVHVPVGAHRAGPPRVEEQNEPDDGVAEAPHHKVEVLAENNCSHSDTLLNHVDQTAKDLADPSELSNQEEFYRRAKIDEANRSTNLFINSLSR